MDHLFAPVEALTESAHCSFDNTIEPARLVARDKQDLAARQVMFYRALAERARSSASFLVLSSSVLLKLAGVRGLELRNLLYIKLCEG